MVIVDGDDLDKQLLGQENQRRYQQCREDFLDDGFPVYEPRTVANEEYIGGLSGIRTLRLSIVGLLTSLGWVTSHDLQQDTLAQSTSSSRVFKAYGYKCS